VEDFVGFQEAACNALTNPCGGMESAITTLSA